MNDRGSALHRFDRAARVAMLSAGLSAQAAMWCASHRGFYPVAGFLLVAVTTVSSLDLVARSNRGRRAGATIKFGACVVLIAACAGSVIDTARRGGGPPSTVAAVGIVLLIAHLVQAASVTRRREIALGAPLVCLMLLQSGVAATDTLPAIPFALALCSLALALGWVHRAQLLAQADVAVFDTRSTLRIGVRHLGAAMALGALVFALLPNSARLGIYQADPHSSAVGSGKQGQAFADPTAGSLDLRVRGPLSDTPVFVTDATAPSYWQGTVYDHYDGTSWTVTNSQPATTWNSTTQGTRTVQQAPAEQQSVPAGPVSSRTDSVQIVSTSALDTVFAPGQATSYVGPGTVHTDASGNLSLVGISASTTTSPQGYQVASTQVATSPAALASATGADPADQRWLQVPAELPARIGQLARQLATGQPTREATVDSIENYLRSNETYDLSAPVAAPGTDAVDDFLFVSHRGFCEQFASAAVVMLRTLGIPARLVTGYAHGDTTTDPGQTVMRASDAHAWVQVWYLGLGWVDSDPTASAVLPPQDKPQDNQGDPATAAAPHERWVPAAAVTALAHAGRPILLGTAVTTAAATLAGLIIGLRRRRRAAAGETARLDEGIPSPVLAAYLRLADRFPEVASRHAETIRETAARVARATAGAVDVSVALDVLERECYGAGPLSRIEIDTAAAVFDAARIEARGVGLAVDVDDTTPAVRDLTRV